MPSDPNKHRADGTSNYGDGEADEKVQEEQDWRSDTICTLRTRDRDDVLKLTLMPRIRSLHTRQAASWISYFVQLLCCGSCILLHKYCSRRWIYNKRKPSSTVAKEIKFEMHQTSTARQMR